MKKLVITLTAIFFVFSIGLGVYIYLGVQKQLSVAAKCPPTIVGVKSLPFEMTYSAIVRDVPKDSKRLELWMPYPRNMAAQTITNVSVKSPYPVEVNFEPVYGNPIMHLAVDNPREDFEVEVTVGVVREELLSARFLEDHTKLLSNSGDFNTYLKEDAVGKITPMLRGLAEKITKHKTTPIDKAQAIYDYIMDTYDYDFEKEFTPKVRGDLTKVCIVAKGACTELNTLFAALARAVEIPVRFVNGFPFRGTPEGDIGGYCCRSEFFASGYGWIPVDPAYGKKIPEDRMFYFGNSDEYRLELVMGRDLELVPRQKNGPINVFLYPYAEVDGAIFKVDKKISWKKEI